MGSGRTMSGLLIEGIWGLERLECWRWGCLFESEYRCGIEMRISTWTGSIQIFHRLR